MPDRRRYPLAECRVRVALNLTQLVIDPSLIRGSRVSTHVRVSVRVFYAIPNNILSRREPMYSAESKLSKTRWEDNVEQAHRYLSTLLHGIM